MFSYDYGAAIKETRLLWEKYDEMKRQAFFIRSSPQFRKTDWIGDNNATGPGIPGVIVNGAETFATFLRNPDSGTGFLIARHLNSSSTYVFLVHTWVRPCLLNLPAYSGTRSASRPR